VIDKRAAQRLLLALDMCEFGERTVRSDRDLQSALHELTAL